MSNDQTPSAAQLSAARSRVWHQSGSTDELQTPESTVIDETEETASEQADVEAAEPSGEEPAAPAAPADAPAQSAALLTLEAARSYVDAMGLLLFRPQPAMATAPAGSFVEATLGEHREEVTLADCELARDLLTRLMAEGSAVALNLLGAPGTTAEMPDFVASAAAFPYVFTLRGDKTWKQLPMTTGPAKVSPLAVNTYALLVEGEPQSASDLTAELGKGLTEAAVLRALGELWQQMRVLPVLQAKGKPTVWEPAAARWTKQLKAGANAGQPTALSALISLYLQQSLLATEEEIATFLSPLAARSRVRDVLHALVAARELQEVVIEGRTYLHVAGELPDLRAVGGAPQASADQPQELLEGEGRIRRMQGGKGERRLERSRPYVARPERRGNDAREDRGPKRFGPRDDRGPKRFASREGGARPERSSGPRGESGREERPRRFDRPWEERAPRRTPQEGQGAGDRPPRRDRPAFGDRERSPYREERPRRFERPREGGDRPAFKRPRPAEGGFNSGRNRTEDSGERRPFPRPSGSPFGRRDESRRGERPAGDAPRPRRDSTGEGRPERRFSGPREGRPSGGDRPGGGDGERRPSFRRFDAPRPGSKPFGRKPFGAGAERAGSDRRPTDRRSADRPAKRPFAGGEGRPPKRDGDRSALRSESPFAKFSGGAKPWGKRPPKPKVKPLTDEERA